MKYAFCEKCDNMMYISLRPDTTGLRQLTYSCKHCGFVTTGASGSGASGTSGGTGGIVVMSTDYEDDQASFRQYATPYLKFDPTLPRSSDIECIQGTKCTRPKDERPEVIYVKYDANKLKYIYHCVHCSAFWKSGGNLLSSDPAEKEPDLTKIPESEIV